MGRLQASLLLLCCRPLILNKSKVLLASASSAYLHSLKEVLASPSLSGQIKVALNAPVQPVESMITGHLHS